MVRHSHCRGRGHRWGRRRRSWRRRRLLLRGEVQVHLFAGGTEGVDVAVELLAHHRLAVQVLDALFGRLDVDEDQPGQAKVLASLGVVLNHHLLLIGVE